jgi:transcriptional regulator with XRE-family HTH domain
MTITSSVLTAPVTNPDERAFLKQLGKNVRVRRVTCDMSQEQLARAARMSRNFVSSVERGAHGVDIVRVVRLAVALRVTLNDLVPPIPEAITAEQPVSQTPRPWPPARFGAGSAAQTDDDDREAG